MSAKLDAASIDSGPMDMSLLQRLVKLMQANDLNTVELRDGDRRVTLKRGPAAAEGPIIVPPIAATTPTAAAAAAEESANLLPIKSPMVGTFYVAPSPDAKPFVSVGSTVDEETDVCIIEAMKVFNNVKAECRGTITKILVSNGQAVEFGQVMFLVKP
ncbi:MAG: acetyl-CoA carboxylase biotin carboxyl carrier protein [Tepidisphaeraceae bacterium]